MDLEIAARSDGAAPRILLTRLRYLGDVILTTPAVAALKARFPAAQVHYLAEAPYAEVLAGNPHIAGVIAMRRGPLGTLRALSAIRRSGFDAAVDFFYNPRSSMLLYISGIPVRVGGSRRWRRRLYTHVASVPPGTRSASAHHIAMLAPLGVRAADALPRVYLSRAELEEGARTIHAAAPGSGAVIAVHPGGTWPAKRWAPERFARLAMGAREAIGAAVVALAGPGEEGIVREVEGSARGAVRALPLMGIRALASALAACDAVVANDGGVMHLAVALGRPTVGVFGPTEPDIWFPYRGKGPFELAARGAPCAPCHRHECDRMECLDTIEPADVLGKLREVLAWKP